MENNISLSKTVYGKTNAKKTLDEEFTEFLSQTKNYKEFFNLYDSFFYDIPKSTHESFLYESNKPLANTIVKVSFHMLNRFSYLINN